jgi:GH24 family phage-related lysozyme (muramidase)
VLESAFNQVFPMQISDAGALFIKQEEGLRLTSYPDAGGYAIGFGHFITANDSVNYGLPSEAGVSISQALADQLFADDSLKVENVINQNVAAVLSQNQFDALADFVYNVGSGDPNAIPPIDGFLTSTLLEKLNAGDYAGAAAEFQKWNKSRGTTSTVLTTRRLAEASLFETA